MAHVNLPRQHRLPEQRRAISGEEADRALGFQRQGVAMDLDAFDDLEAAFVRLPVGQMIEACAPAAFKVRASCQARLP